MSETKKILFASTNPHSIYLKNLARESVNRYEGLSIDMIDIARNDFYHFKSEESSFALVPDEITKRGKTISELWKTRSLIKGLASYESVTMHAPSVRYALYMGDLAGRAKRANVVIWGSDFYAITSSWKQKLQRYIYNRADRMVISTVQGKLDLVKRVPSVENKITNIKFGNNNIELINVETINEIKKSLRKEYGVKDGKMVFCLGHKAEAEQQHLRVLENLFQLDTLLLDKLHIVIPLTYPRGAYAEKLEKDILEFFDQKDFQDYTLLTDFLSDEEISNLRIVSDIYINARTHDLFAAAVMEHLYAQNVVCVPEWQVTCDELKEMKADFFDFNWENLQDVLTKAINRADRNASSLTHNSEIIHNHISWDSVAPKWLDIFLN